MCITCSWSSGASGTAAPAAWNSVRTPVWCSKRASERPDPVLEVALGDARAEVHEQFAHVGVGLLHAGLDFVEDADRLAMIPLVLRLAQHLRLQVEEGERLRDGVVELLREQVALLGDGELAIARREPQRLDGHAEVLAQRREHVALLARRRPRLR